MTIAAPPDAIVKCSWCQKDRKAKLTKSGQPRTPMGWHRIGETEEVACNECWNKKYMLRAISMRIVEPLNVSWEALRKLLKPMWRATTAASNRIVTELYTLDHRRKEGEAKMPKMQPQYLYPKLRQEYPDLPSQSVAALEQAVQKKYRAARYQTVWTGQKSLPNFRYPTPFAVPNQGWNCRIENERPIVALRIGDQRVEVRLKAGPQFRRQLNQFRLIARGEAVQGECAIYQHEAVLMMKMVAWLPRPQSVKDAEGTLVVRTGKSSLLTAVNLKDEALWTYNGDHLRRWTAEHRRRLQRWSEDAKYESRPTPNFQDRRTAAVEKFHNRMNSATHEISAQLAGYAQRRKFAEVRYEDEEKGFCDQFPWYRLKQLIGQKLDERGITFIAKEDTPVTSELP